MWVERCIAFQRNSTLTGMYLIARASLHPAVVAPSSGRSAAVPGYGRARHGVLLRCGHSGRCRLLDVPFRGRDGQPLGGILNAPCVQPTAQCAATVPFGFGVGVLLPTARVVSSGGTQDAWCVQPFHPAAVVLLVAGRTRGTISVHHVPGDGRCHDRRFDTPRPEIPKQRIIFV